MKIGDLRLKIADFEAEKKFLSNKIKEIETRKVRLKKEMEIQEKARIVLQDVSEKTQANFFGVVEKLVTSALQSVYQKDISFKFILEKKRNKIEARPVVIENGYEYDILSEKGGGLLPVIGFSLRCVLWSLSPNPTRNLIILDEFVKGSLGGELLKRTFKMISEVSKKMNIQVIAITHYNELSEYADKLFHVKQFNGISEVNCERKD